MELSLHVKGCYQTAFNRFELGKYKTRFVSLDRMFPGVKPRHKTTLKHAPFHLYAPIATMLQCFMMDEERILT